MVSEKTQFKNWKKSSMDLSIDELPAVKALGPLFKLTEVHLWDDGSSEVRELPYVQEPTKLANGDNDYKTSDSTRFNGFCSLPEDVELAKKMNDLGLPLSFHTNKEKRNGMTSGKRKGARKNIQQNPIEIDEYMLDPMKVIEEDSGPPASLMLDQSESLQNEAVADAGGLSNLSLEQGDSTSSTPCTSTISNEHDYNGEVSNIGFGHSLGCSPGVSNNMLEEATGLCLDGGTSEGSCLMNEGADCDVRDIKETLSVIDRETEGQLNGVSFEVIQDSDAAEHAQFSEQTNSNMIDNNQYAYSGEWIAYWDDFHKRNYFYNVKTEESTWDPPPGMEHLAYGSIADEQMDSHKSDEAQASSDLQPHLDLAKELRTDDGLLGQQLDEFTGNWLSTDNISSTVTTKRKKKVRRTKYNWKLSISNEDQQGVLQEVHPSISKYWCQRYLLFSRFDDGIQMDEEGWFSVTPEPIAKHHAARCGNGAIVDFFTGVGGNAIQFAQWSGNVIAIDIDPNKIEYARHNAAIYGVDDNIDFIKGDSFALAHRLKADTVFMSPPWGGPAYSKVKKFDVNTMLKPQDGQVLFDAGKRIAPQIVMFLPRNVDINQLAELSLSATPPWSLEVERNFLNDRLKAVTAYFSETSMS